jgi:hypothetical protein
LPADLLQQFRVGIAFAQEAAPFDTRAMRFTSALSS